MSNLTEFKEKLFDLKESQNLQQWCNSVNEIIGLYDLDDEEIHQTILDTLPHELISRTDAMNLQAESYPDLLQALQDSEFSKNCGNLFKEISSNKEMDSEKFEELFDKLQAETRSAQELKPFLAAFALQDDQRKRNAILECLSKFPGITYEDAVMNVAADKN